MARIFSGTLRIISSNTASSAIKRTVMTSAHSTAGDGSLGAIPPIEPIRRSHLFPFPGFTPESATAAQRVLEENHQKYHIFFNDKGFHNHLSHHVLAALSLGLPASSFNKIFEKERDGMLNPAWEYNKRPRVVPSIDHAHKPADYGKFGGVVEEITEANWTQFHDSRAHYWAYVPFFQRYITEHGTTAALERFVFSEEANDTLKDGRRLDMLARFIGGALHPMIHVGYGAEFGLPGITAEGLAMAMITENRQRKLFPSHINDLAPIVGGTAANVVQTVQSAAKGILPASIVEAAAARVGNINIGGGSTAQTTASASKPHAGLSLLSVLELIGQDPKLAPGAAVKHDDDFKMLSAARNAVPVLAERGYFDLWKFTAEDVKDPHPRTNEGGWADKWEELVWVAALMMGATSRPGGELKHDFFMMHVNNAILFLPSLLPELTPASRAKLLQGFARAAAVIWIARGRPAFYITERLNKSTASPYNPNESTKHGSKDIVGSEKGSGASPWYSLCAAACVHSDEHLTKAVRALAFFSQYFGHRPAGALSVQTDAVKVEMQRLGLPLERFDTVYKGGIEHLDGTAFIRAAGQLFETQGWTRDDHDNLWNYEGIGFPEVWK